MTRTLSLRTGAPYIAVLAFTLVSLALAAHAQDNPADDASSTCVAIRNSPTQARTFYLANATTQQEGSEIQIAIQNVLCPGVHIYYAPSQNAIIIEAPPQQLDLADRIIHDLDHSRRTYRLTFTLTELDNGKTISTQHVAIAAVIGEHTTLRQGDKIPIATSLTGSEKSPDTQFTYIDIGTAFDFTITEQANGVSLTSKVEYSSVGSSQTIMGVTEPVIRQTVLQGTSLLTLDKPVMLGSLDIPNSTRHFDIAVVMDQVK